MKTLFSKEMRRFNHLISEMEGAYHEAALKIGMSDSVLQILYTICNFGDRCLISDIIKLNSMSKQTANSALKKLESEEIIELKAYDGKRKMVILTEKGNELVKESVSKLINIENRILDSWTEEDVEKYIELTEKYMREFKEGIKTL